MSTRPVSPPSSGGAVCTRTGTWSRHVYLRPSGGAGRSGCHVVSLFFYWLSGSRHPPAYHRGPGPSLPSMPSVRRAIEYGASPSVGCGRGGRPKRSAAASMVMVSFACVGDREKKMGEAGGAMIRPRTTGGQSTWSQSIVIQTQRQKQPRGPGARTCGAYGARSVWRSHGLWVFLVLQVGEQER